MKKSIIFCSFLMVILGCTSQLAAQPVTPKDQRILAGAERINVYLPLIKGKKLGIFANQTSMVGNTHLIDTLRKLGVDIKVIFGPEHGFRGQG